MELENIHGHDENYKETKNWIIKRENYCRWKKIFIHFMVKLILKPEIYNKKYYIYTMKKINLQHLFT